MTAIPRTALTYGYSVVFFFCLQGLIPARCGESGAIGHRTNPEILAPKGRASEGKIPPGRFAAACIASSKTVHTNETASAELARPPAEAYIAPRYFSQNLSMIRRSAFSISSAAVLASLLPASFSPVSAQSIDSLIGCYSVDKPSSRPFFTVKRAGSDFTIALIGERPDRAGLANAAERADLASGIEDETGVKVQVQAALASRDAVVGFFRPSIGNRFGSTSVALLDYMVGAYLAFRVTCPK